jgi:DNA-binding HxlR family transcriptional regulator
MSSAQRRSPCPVACTLDIVGDRWTLLVVRDLVLGKTTFKEFLASPERIASNTLAERLARLVEHGLVETRAGDRVDRVTYHLTAKGRTLKPLVRAIAKWGLANVEGTRALLGGFE